MRRPPAPDGDWEDGWDSLVVRALYEGDEIAPYQTVMTIEGDYSLFAHLETVYLGCMARRTLVMRNVASGRPRRRGQAHPLLSRPPRPLARPDRRRLGGARGGRDRRLDRRPASWWGGRGVGTVPHGLIAAYGGDTVTAATAFAARYYGEMNITVLVDFDNDSVQTALDVASALGDRLWGVRLDTSERLVDRALQEVPNQEAHHGVTPLLAQRVRRALDLGGYEHVRIVVSGGFNPAKITAFEAAGAPVDAYGVGSSLLRGSNDFTADVVRVDGRPVAKAGRSEKPNPRLTAVE